MSQVSEIWQPLRGVFFPKRTIAIVGGGFSGVLVATQLLKHSSMIAFQAVRSTIAPIEIKLIESKSVLGRGVAYSTDISCHVLNVPAGKMSAFPDEPDHFFNWLEKREDLLKELGDESLTPGTFVPRKIYGIYGQAILEDAIRNAAPHVTFEWIKEDAIDISPQGENNEITLSNGEKMIAEKIVLALGNFPPANPTIEDPSFYQDQEHYISYPWGAHVFDSIKPDENILLIGSGLTMVDVAIGLKAKNYQGQIYVVSRHGFLPQSHQTSPPYPGLHLTKITPLSIRNLLRQVRQIIKQAETQGINLRGVIDAIRPETQVLWQSLSLEEKRRFLRHLRPYWEIHRHRVAPKIFGLLQEMLNSHQLQVIAGKVQKFAVTPKGVDVFVKPRYSNNDEFTRFTVNRVINCTGSECDYRQFKHPLIVNLRDRGLIRPDSLNLGLDVASNGALIGEKGVVSSGLYTLGSPCKGCLWETTAIPEIRQQAIALSQEVGWVEKINPQTLDNI